MADPARIANLLNLPMLEKAILDLRAEVERLTRERDEAQFLLAGKERVRLSDNAHLLTRATAAEAERDRLREALEETLDWCEAARASGDCGFWDWEPNSFYVRARAVLKREA